MEHVRIRFPKTVCPLCNGECRHSNLELHRRAQATLAVCPLCEGICRHQKESKLDLPRKTLPIDIAPLVREYLCWGCDRPFSECYPETSRSSCDSMRSAYRTMLNNQTMTACRHVVSECTNPICDESDLTTAPIGCTVCQQRGMNCVCEFVKEHGRELLYDAFYRLTPGMISKYSVRIMLIDTKQATLDRLRNYFGCLFAEDDTILCEIGEYLEATLWGTEEADHDYENALLEDYCLHINKRLAPVDMILVEDPRNHDILDVFVQRDYDMLCMKLAKEAQHATNS